MEQKISNFIKEQQINYLTFDSRDIPKDQGNVLFFAIKGTNVDGNKFIDQVLQHSNVFVFTDSNQEVTRERVTYVEDCRFALSIAAGCLYPKTPEYMFAVTGTNGKSSVVSYIMQLCSKLDKNAISASIGTLGINASRPINVDEYADEQAKYTTSNPILLRRILHRMAEEGVKYVAMEVSSHALDQKRLGNLEFDTAGLVSFSRDHLDYHQTMEKYLVAKLRLFTLHLKEKGKAVLTNDNENLEYVDSFLKFCKIPYDIITDENLPINNLAKDLLFVHSYIPLLSGQKLALNIGSKEYNVEINIHAKYQAKNLLLACQMIKNIGFQFEDIIKFLPEITTPPGRLQKVKSDSYNIFIDYAHTKDAIEKTLIEMRNITPKGAKLVVLFGCGGERDIGKRQDMGRAAATLADLAVITDDNPRNEDPEKIRSEITRGMNTKTAFKEIAGRKEAIKYAISTLKRDDVLLIAGKGHENYQIIGDEKIYFNDFECATDQLKTFEKV